MILNKHLFISLIFFISFFQSILGQGGTFYVTTNGSSGKDGRTEQTAWSLQHAIKTARAGDIVYIKAGNYGSLQWRQDASGSPGNTIKFIGYRDRPGDVQSSNGPDVKYGDNVDPSKMPLLKGYENSGTAITVIGSYVEFHNLQITGYTWGVNGFGHDLTVRNMALQQIGPKVKGSAYQGNGIVLRGANNLVENSIVVNAGVEGITLYNCDNSRVQNSEVATDNVQNATDYFILLIGGTKNSTVDNCTVRRGQGLKHPGHGLVAKNGAHNNTIKNSRAINTGIEMSYSNVHDNLIKDCTVQGTYNQDGDTSSNIKVANGAHHNTFENVQVDGAFGALAFSDWNESQPYDQNNAGNNNRYVNVRVSNSANGIYFTEFEKTGSQVNDNTFTDCTFTNVVTLFRVNRPNSGNRMVNCTVENSKTLWNTSQGYGYQLNPNTVFDNVTWKNVDFNIPNQ